MQGRTVAFSAYELPGALQLTLLQDRFQLDWADERAEATLSGALAALCQVGLAQADGDALFFQRRLSMEGDTELALEVKSLLARYPLARLPSWPLLSPGGR
ncbi:hypothetical protein GCM10023333_09390 [Ferrimonas pelagia]|uniref:SCP2 domain-containing protein n=2 Tax=Ferrimonas pelagia TaxID=1177826 RepID=A0ABP9EH00_9GAMM